jgi:hypothetical protein
MNLVLSAVSLTFAVERVRSFAQLMCNLHAASISSKASHALRLHCSHSQKIFHIAHVRRQLCELRM